MKTIPSQLIWAICALAASFSPAGGAVLNPVADTYVKNSTATSNFGAATNFIANNANGVRVSFLRFDLSAIPGPITNARLELTINLAAAGQTFNVYGLTNGENWSETGLTWGSAPAVVNSYVSSTGTLAQYLQPADLFGNGMVLNTFTSGAAIGDVDVAFDSTPAVLNFINADEDKVVTFVIAEPDPVDTSGVAWNSREAATGQPNLIINLPVTNPVPGTNSVQIIKVYLQGGQSNSDGRAKTNGLPVNLLQPQSDVPIYYYLKGGAANGDGTLGHLTTLRTGLSAQGSGTLFGPELTFGRTLADYYALSNGVSTNTLQVALIKYADGGTTLVADWAANGNSSTNGDGPDYVVFQKVVAAGLSNLASAYPNAVIELDGMIWVQGESDIDAGASASGAYRTNLTRFINDLRLTYATRQPYGTNLPFFLSRISANQTYYSLPSDASYSNYLLLRAGQAAVAATLTNVFVIDTDGSQFTTLTPYASPGLHFDTGGQLAMGAAFGEAVRQALPPPQLQVPVESIGGWQVTFTGVTGTTHSLKQAASVAGPWTPLTNILMNQTGWATNEAPRLPAAFYRVSRP